MQFPPLSGVFIPQGAYFYWRETFQGTLPEAPNRFETQRDFRQKRVETPFWGGRQGGTMLTSIQIIALTIALEASTQGSIGRQHVASSVYNRAPDCRAQTLVDVCLKPMQYSVWNKKVPSIKLVQEICATEQGLVLWMECMVLAQRMVRGIFVPTTPATHYVTVQLYNSPFRPAWTNRLEVVETYHDHIFFREV
jgi:hypothetical protein